MGSMEDALRKAGLTPTPTAPEPLAEKPCARCGKQFQPARPQHRMCDECAAAVRAERAVAGPAKPGEHAPREPREAHAAREPREPREPREAREARPAEAGPAESAAARPPRFDRERRPPRRDRPGMAEGFGHRPAPRDLPHDYLSSGYYAPDGSLHRQLLTGWAEQVAQAIASGATEPTAVQVRLFANTVKRADAAVKYGKQPVEHVLNEVEKMKAFAAERAARRKVPESFRRFIEANVDRVTDAKSLRAFAQHFQAVEAYASGLLQMRKERR